MSRDDTGSAGFFTFLAGSIVGAAVALLSAPRTGRETRKLLAEYSDEFRDREFHLPGDITVNTSEAIDRGREMINRGRELINRGTDIASHGKEYLEEKKKALSSAIEAGKDAMQHEKEALDAATDEEEKKEKKSQ